MDILNDPRDADDWDPLRGVYGFLDDDGEWHDRNVYDGPHAKEEDTNEEDTDDDETEDEKQAAVDAALKWLL